jgi:hypothetical protein
MTPILPPSAVEVVPRCVHVVPGWLPAGDATVLQHELTLELCKHLRPHRGFRGFPDRRRLTARLGDPGVEYVYDGRSHALAPFTAFLRWLRDDVAAALGTPFNCCYVNLYVDGTASLARHSDTPKLPQLGPEPVIAAVSFGAPRLFQLWAADAPRNKDRMAQHALGHGDLCVMHGRSQADWLHGVPRQPEVTVPRLSVTFRHHSQAV